MISKLRLFILLNRLILAAIALLIACLGAGTIWGFDSARNRGWEFGYWGDFNCVKEALEDLSAGRVLKDWSNQDVVLGEFGFVVKTSNGRRVDLEFGESDPIRHLRGRRLHDALRQRLKT